MTENTVRFVMKIRGNEENETEVEKYSQQNFLPTIGQQVLIFRGEEKLLASYATIKAHYFKDNDSVPTVRLVASRRNELIVNILAKLFKYGWSINKE